MDVLIAALATSWHVYVSRVRVWRPHSCFLALHSLSWLCCGWWFWLWVLVCQFCLIVDEFGCGFLGSWCGFDLGLGLKGRWWVAGGRWWLGFWFCSGFWWLRFCYGFRFRWYQFCYGFWFQWFWFSSGLGFGGYGFIVCFDFGGLDFLVG